MDLDSLTCTPSLVKVRSWLGDGSSTTMPATQATRGERRLADIVKYRSEYLTIPTVSDQRGESMTLSEFSQVSSRNIATAAIGVRRLEIGCGEVGTFSQIPGAYLGVPVMFNCIPVVFCLSKLK